jgi:hypothetical protein
MKKSIKKYESGGPIKDSIPSGVPFPNESKKRLLEIAKSMPPPKITPYKTYKKGGSVSKKKK